MKFSRGNSKKNSGDHIRRGTEGLSPYELIEKRYSVFTNGITPELREYLRKERFGPSETYRMAVRFIRDVFKEIQENIFYPATFLDFGTGDGFSLRQLVGHLDINTFHHVCLYDINQTNLKYLRPIKSKEGYIEYTTDKPVGQFDFVNMFFVAGIDFNSIGQATALTKQGGYLLLFDYHFNSANESEIKSICNTNLERRIMQERGFDYLLQRATQYRLLDYGAKFEHLGIETYLQQEIGGKFCVIIGKKPLEQ